MISEEARRKSERKERNSKPRLSFLIAHYIRLRLAIMKGKTSYTFELYEIRPCERRYLENKGFTVDTEIYHKVYW